MRQVPTYLLIGSGRVAQHFRRYLELLGLPFETFARADAPTALSALSERCSPILLLISDQALATFRESHPCLKDKLLVHFSGALTVPHMHAAHPLMTFVPGLYDLNTYRQIPFILNEEGPSACELLPGLDNPTYRIPEALRPYYHALCVLSGNFTALLWQKFFKELEERFHLPQELAYPYLTQVMRNLMTASSQALSGPLVRGDQATIQANLTALNGDNYQQIYAAFVAAFQKPHTHPQGDPTT